VFAQEEELMPLEKMPYPMNTDAYDEGGPILSMDGMSLYFTRSGSPDFDRTLLKEGLDVWTTHPEHEYKDVLGAIYSEISNRHIAEPYSSQFNQDIWIAHFAADTLTHVTHPGFPINNALPNSVVSARLDTNQLVVINQFYSDGSMYEGFSSVSGGFDDMFNFPEPLHIYNFYNISSDVNLALSTRGQVMILSLERADSHGEKDLYVSFKITGDLWSEPQNLGSVLNTRFTETTPFVTDDNRKLYFATDRPGTKGGLDIYVSERLDYTWLRWTDPKPVDLPVNSESDDLQPFVDHINSNFYFSSRRDGTSDIYRQPLKPKPRLKEPLRIKGMIVDGLTLQPVRAELLHGPVDVANYLEYMHTYTGEFTYTLTEYGVYKFLAHKPGYEDARLMFDTRLAEKANLPVHEVILYMYRDSESPVAAPIPIVRIPEFPEPRFIITMRGQVGVVLEEVFSPVVDEHPKVGDKLTFFNIYFEQSKADILPTSKKALDDLFRILTTYDDVYIRIGGHTDNVGNELDLMKLSWERAQAVKADLVMKGINPIRIGTVGHGDTQPIADNWTESGRIKNRRVEIQVIE
jgi:outer membrane protein OmpA-like peptidoglycan-associated protein